jgi:alpha,alpha-trehalase
MQSPFNRFQNNKRLQAQITNLGPGLARPKASPDELLGELFADVQLKRVHADGMTFVDQVPAERMNKILKTYERQRENPNFNLHKFVAEYFKDYLAEQRLDYHSNPENTITQHVTELWDVLTRTAYKNSGSLVALPYPYIVPGGRFGAQFYWDTYFTMQGLAASGRWDLVEGMVKNYAFMIRKIGYIPTANRTYFLSRSQPPFFAHMVRLLAEEKGKLTLVRYLPYLLTEYRFWMKGAKQLGADNTANRRTVFMPDESILNRYYDNKRTPRPESYKEDVETASEAYDRVASQVYLDLRAGAESGWDFSSRWLKDGKTLHTIHTTDIVPIDLNCLLLDLENTIAETYHILKQGKLAARFEAQAQARIDSMNKYCWSSKDGFYFDYDFMIGDCTYRKTIAAAYPLFSRAASQEQAAAVAKCLKREFLKDGGLLTTLDYTGQQWDAPNGWAPMHWIAIQGLRNYGYGELADEIKKRWIATNLAIYQSQGKLVEKYNVVDTGNGSGGGGEYPLQDGFGWTNGVLLALLKEDEPTQA